MREAYHKTKSVILSLFITILVGCASTTDKNSGFQIPLPSELLTPNYVEGSSGKYMSPFTSDLVVTEWVDKAIDANIGANLGGLIGTHVGQVILSEIPFVGSTIGKEIGESAGYSLALNAIGGDEFLRESTDISFNSLKDMSIYLYKYNSEHRSYLEAVKATMVLYPGLKDVYNASIINAPRW